jgi:hypothetical protein
MICTLYTGENQTEVLVRLSQQSFELVIIFKVASRNFIFIFYCKKAALTIKIICAYTESTDLISNAFKKIYLVTESL